MYRKLEKPNNNCERCKKPYLLVGDGRSYYMIFSNYTFVCEKCRDELYELRADHRKHLDEVYEEYGPY